jgi:chemotaxis protein methyltransferase CheR
MRLNSFSEYLNILKKDLIRTEIIKLFNEITVNETFFFRDMPQLKALKDQILPQIQPRGSVRILSAGCSSGEEGYTLSIILREYFPSLSFSIIGIDISDQVVAKAIKGHYSDYAVRFVPQPIKQKYFVHQGESQWVFQEEWKKGVEFRKMNLMDLDSQVMSNRFDIIFCRYVLIYFDLESKKKVVSNFYKCINPHGHLFMGNSESLYSVTDEFDMMHFPSAIVYKKKEK